MIACPLRGRHTTGAQSDQVLEGDEATSDVRIVMRDNVLADRAEPGVNRLPTAAKHSMPVNLLCSARLKRAGEFDGPQSEHTARHRPPVTPANTKWA
jgi:hypothetical protein